jgi:hypothetical protein
MDEVKLKVTPPEKRRLEEFLKVLRTPCIVKGNPDSFFNTSLFEEEFRSKLLTHHCFMGSPLFQESFEAAFITSCEYAGLSVERAPDGQRFWDVRVEGFQISLKSSKARDLKKKKLHISKLTEAAWVQDCRTAKMRRDKTLNLFEEYCSEVDSIIQLRYFRSTKFYELVEFPVELFKQIKTADLSHFSADGPTINIPIGKEPPDFTLKIDRSDAKITIANINKDICTVHGTWKL